MEGQKMLQYLEELKEKLQNRESTADLHTHTHCSDGAKSVSSLVKIAKDSGLSFLAITDHNTPGYIRGVSSLVTGYSAKSSDIFVDVDGLVVIPGVEITNRCYYAKNRPGYNAEYKRNWTDVYEKFHMVVLGADRNPRFDFNKLMALKHKSDIISDYGVFGFCNKEFNTEFSLPDVKKIIQKEKFKNPNFQYFKPAEVARIVEKRLIELGRPVEKRTILGALNSHEGKIVCSGYQNRLNLDSADVITTAKCAGGTTIWAHPHFEVKKEARRAALGELIRQGLDGVEVYYSRFIGHQTSFTDYMDDGHEHPELNLLWSGGSDFHTEIHAKNRVGKAWNKDIVAQDLTVIDALIEKQAERTTALLRGEDLPYHDTYLSKKIVDKYSHIYDVKCQPIEDLIKFDEIDYLNSQLNNPSSQQVVENESASFDEKPEDEFVVDDRFIEELEAEEVASKKGKNSYWKDVLKSLEIKDDVMGDE